MRHSKGSYKTVVYTDTGLPQEIRKISNKQPNLPYKGSRKRRTNKTQNQKEGNNKDQSKNKIETSEQTKQWKRSNEAKSCFFFLKG